MNLQGAVLAAALASVVSVSLGGTETNVRLEVADETAESEWECSLSTSTYLAQHARDYANPNFTADRDWLHLEARYNYEALKTGSLWLGYNFSVGKKLTLDATPMIGGVFGDITGIAPGYTISISYEPFELFTQGEYFFDAAIHAGNFSIAGRNSVALPQAGSELASSWIGPKRSVVNSTFVADRWSDSNIKSRFYNVLA